MRRFLIDTDTASDDPIAMAHAIDPRPSAISRLWVDVMAGDGPQRGVMDVDQIGITGAVADIDLVTHHPADHFFDMLFWLLQD